MQRKQDKENKDFLESVPEQAFKQALLARSRAWAPYSEFQVGAVLGFADGSLVEGVNVENASFGATICAERSAMVSAISQQGKREPEFLVVATKAEPPSPPCGLCLQVLVEFCKPEMPVYLINNKGSVVIAKLRDYLPRSFTSFE